MKYEIIKNHVENISFCIKNYSWQIIDLINYIFHLLTIFRYDKHSFYFFFDNVLQYIEKADNAKIDLTSDGAYSCCESFYNLWNSKLNTEENAKTICKQFIKLYKSLPHIKGLSNNDLACKKDCGFFNYWLNFKLYNNVINNDICVFTFYNELESHCSEELQHSLSKCKMCNIMKDELDNMTILYNLYNKRNEINTIIN
ncbi:hypothetical protein PVBG_06150 [Plasmodium vivax Brazil I]|uniref:Variable surface protein n=1 Tax=Plasmodium vivax (strain Brazil I) TaxID=1033975 RepID=A0A0J9VB21_PLAV1|nr:hypothetical protein PVBG_06150 [Plasmodium vivax Brazil I]